jgi:hypothetical protein
MPDLRIRISCTRREHRPVAANTSLTRRSFGMLGAAMLASLPALAEQSSADKPPSADTLRADADLVQRAYEAIHPGLNTPAQMNGHFDAVSCSSSEWPQRIQLA